MPSLQVDVERARAGPEVVILPNTPPMAVATQAHDYAPDTDLLTDHGDHNHDGLHVPSSAVHERHQDRKPIDPNTQSQILTALSVGVSTITSQFRITILMEYPAGPAHRLGGLVLHECHSGRLHLRSRPRP